MPIEFDDRGLRIIGADVYALEFYDDSRVLQQRIYLQSDNTLNIGDAGTGEGGTGGGTSGDGAPAAAQYLVLSLHDELANCRRLDIGGGLTAIDRGASGDYDLGLDWGTPTVGTIEPDDAAAAGTGTNPARSDHQHAIAAAAPAANSVNLAASAEGAASSFARSDHTHNLSEAITPTWTGNHLYSAATQMQLRDAALVIYSSADGQLDIDADVEIELTAPTIHAVGQLDLDGDLRFVGAQSITSTAGNLTLAPAGDLILNPAGNDVLPESNYDINLGSLAAKYLTLHAAELWVETLVAQDTIATIGGRILVGPTTILTVDLGDGAGDTVITAKHNQMAIGDRVYMEADGKVEFLAVTGGPVGAGPYVYTVTRNLDGSGRNLWYAGDAVFNTGATGDGFIDLYSVHGVKAANEYGPTIVGNVRDSAAYNDWSEHWAIGQLNGLYGYGASTWGVGLGEYAAGQPHLTIDSTDGIRIYDGLATVIGQWDTSGNILVGQTGAGQSNVLITAGAVQLRNNTTPKITLSASGAVTIDQYGEMFFSAADGLLLLGPRCPIEPTSWTSLRKQTATISGAFHQAAGRWAGTKALRIEPAGTNLVVNPSFEVNVTDGWEAAGAGGSVSRSTVCAVVGTASCKFSQTDASSYVQTDTLVTNPAQGAVYTAYFYIRTDDAASIGDTVRLRIYEKGGATGNAYTQTETTVTSTWQKVEVTRTVVENDRTILLLLVEVSGSANTHYLYFDSVQVEATAYATSFIDGTLGTGYSWAGAAHNSTSSRTDTEVNLDVLVDLISSNDIFSMAMWVQMPYDHDATWPDDGAGSVRHIVQLLGVGNLFFFYDTLNEDFRVYYNAGTRLDSSAQTFNAGDWMHLVITFDYSADNYKLYANGVEEDTNADVLSAQAYTDWTLGSETDGTDQSGYAFSEYAVFDRVLTAAEVAAMYVMEKQMVDAGAIDTPGLYILDGKFRIASSDSDTGFEITAEEIVGKSGGTDQVVISAETGKLTAGAGKVTLNADGIGVTAGSAAYTANEAYKLFASDGSTLSGYLGMFDIPGTAHEVELIAPSVAGEESWMQLGTVAPSGQIAQTILRATETGGNMVGITVHSDGYINCLGGDVRIALGLYIGGVGTDPDTDDVWCDGEISTDGGTTKWDLGAYTVGAPTPDGYLTVVVEGVTYRISVDRQ